MQSTTLSAARQASPVYDTAAPQSRAFREFRDLWRFRSLLRLMVLNQLRVRYRRSLLGIAWILLYPLLYTFILSIAFGSLLRTGVANYPVFVMVGLLVWNLYLQTTTTGVDAAVYGSRLATQLYLPRTLFVMTAAGSALINFLVGLVPLALLTILSKGALPYTWLLFPLPLAITLVFVIGITLLVATLAVYFADVAHLYSLLSQAIFFLTPIIYAAESIPQPFRLLVELNPITPMVLLTRAVLADGRLPDPILLLEAGGVALFSFVLGWWLFSEKAPEFAYYV